MQEILIETPDWSELINPRFEELIDNTDRYLICYGGRGSSKSDFATKKLIWRCISEPFFRCILIRKTYQTIADSQYKSIKECIEDWGLSHLFTFKLQPLEIHFINGNSFLARGCDDTSKIKSIKDATSAWYEEEVPEEKDFITITSSIRTSRATYLQEIFSINPEVEGNFEENWFWKKFFQGKASKSFRNQAMVKIQVRGIEKEIPITYTAHHSTYEDNPFVPDSFLAYLESLKSNPYFYAVYCLGEWGNKDTGGLFYKDFSRSKHLSSTGYDYQHPVHLTFDFNVRPYMTLCVWQIFGKKAIQVDELLGTEPLNNTQGVCNMFINKYGKHDSGLFVYGDPAGKHQDTRTEKGANDYDIISKALRQYKPRFRVAEMAPSVTARGGFINSIFRGEEQGIEILFNKSLNYTLMDYSYGKEAMDGTKLKEKFKDERTGIPAERYHHITDANDYFITIVFRNEFNNYLRGGRKREYLTDDPRPEFNRL